MHHASHISQNTAIGANTADPSALWGCSTVHGMRLPPLCSRGHYTLTLSAGFGGFRIVNEAAEGVGVSREVVNLASAETFHAHWHGFLAHE